MLLAGRQQAACYVGKPPVISLWASLTFSPCVPADHATLVHWPFGESKRSPAQSGSLILETEQKQGGAHLSVQW